MAYKDIPTRPLPVDVGPEIPPLPLGSPIQPRFFWGQLLTDQDLTQLVEWVQDRFRLGRYREGWGVVNGLSVSYDPDNHSQVIVGPGYAVSNWGDDIIVPTNTLFNLEEVYRLKQTNCARVMAEAETNGKDIQLGSQTYPMKEVCVIDLYIAYAEQPTEPRATLGRTPHRQADVYENSRTQEHFKLLWRLAEERESPAIVANRWQEDYQAWLSDQKADWDPEMDAADQLLHLMQNYYSAPVSGILSRTQEDGTVPLARLWLQIGASNPQTVLAIDPYPPHRRLFQPDALPAPTGYVNLAHLLWHRWETGFNILNDFLHSIGIEVVDTRLFDEEQHAEAVAVVLAGQVCVPYGSSLAVCAVNMGNVLGTRIVGFQDVLLSSNESEAIDKLKQIKGIGAKSAQFLVQAGYHTPAAVAEADSETLEALLRKAGLVNFDIDEIKASAAALG